MIASDILKEDELTKGLSIARETSRQLGLGTNIFNADRLGLGGGGDMPGSEVYDFVEAADGFAEVFPQHKCEFPTNPSSHP